MQKREIFKLYTVTVYISNHKKKVRVQITILYMRRGVFTREKLGMSEHDTND